jgi:hypothetical protein
MTQIDPKFSFDANNHKLIRSRKFRKKPVVIDAFQYTGESSTNNFPSWLKEAAIDMKVYFNTHHGMSLTIKTLEGDHRADINDWIIKGIKNELYPCNPDIFEATYEEVDQ